MRQRRNTKKCSATKEGVEFPLQGYSAESVHMATLPSLWDLFTLECFQDGSLIPKRQHTLLTNPGLAEITEPHARLTSITPQYMHLRSSTASLFLPTHFFFRLMPLTIEKISIIWTMGCLKQNNGSPSFPQVSTCNFLPQAYIIWAMSKHSFLGKGKSKATLHCEP